ncbi:MotA/TolQ/ExbB proton channel family protein [Candidatus Berkiella cookevillensis]|uniref:Biopolymer transport protein ExbB n=1 Tax=Candidatus Berkiella cookevillensis TaxID=437022 RepID=A0A0Q9YPV4_9GAMM|nr:MotA/TolQ/ExbB proton channel family protein [Candidatus Berkiella cookevillensis]MCS5708984.1 MotA/TolQ/ExbB proton channel family protein [Candidatus Berkiella cookevillensis]
MLVLFQSGGWLMWPLLVCSIISLAIVVERAWTLRETNILPPDLVKSILSELSKKNQTVHLPNLAYNSPLGIILAVGLKYSENGVSIMRVRMEEQGRQVVMRLEKYLNALGTIASVSPLLGLLGTVMGMINIFTALNLHETANTEVLAGGIAQALLTTAFGLSIAIPSLMFHRHFQRKIDELSVKLENESLLLIDGLKAIVPRQKKVII